MLTKLFRNQNLQASLKEAFPETWESLLKAVLSGNPIDPEIETTLEEQ